MNIGNVSNNGGVDRGAERSARADGKRGQAVKAVTTGDNASISSDGQKAAAAFEAKVAAAVAEPTERDERVVRAIQRLSGGELDKPAVMQETAAAMLGLGFKTI